jgi:hypothetical protein
MRLADANLIVRVEGQEFILRPTLRAAYRLERQFGGFAPLMRQLLDGSLTAMAAVIREASSNPSDLPAFLEGIQSMPLRTGIDPLRTVLITFVCDLAGIDPDQQDEPRPSSRMEAKDYHEHLFKIGTGWLGWTPEATWNATIPELRAAYEGRLEMLKAIFGSEKDKTETVPEEDGWHVLRAMAASGQNKAS